MGEDNDSDAPEDLGEILYSDDGEEFELTLESQGDSFGSASVDESTTLDEDNDE